MPRRSFTYILRLAALHGAVLLFAATNLCAQTVDQLSGLVEKWTKLEQTKSNEQRRWDEEKSILAARIKLLENQKENLMRQQQQLADQNKQNQHTLSQLKTKAENATAVLSQLDKIRVQAREKLENIRAKLPAMFLKQLPPLPQTTSDQTTSQGFIDLCAEYQNLLKAQNKVHSIKWIIKGPDSLEREYDVVSIGSCAFFAHCPQTNLAGFAQNTSKTGLEWHWDSPYAQSIIHAVENGIKETNASLVHLPFKLKEEGTK